MKTAASIALGALLAACHGGRSEPLPPEDELWIAREAFDRGEARLVAARSQLIAGPIATGGRIAFDDQRVSHVFSPVTGRVTRVIAQLGQPVHAGTPLAAIASPDVGSAVSDVVKARADLTAAEHDYRRQERLHEEHAAATRDYENAEDNFRRAKAEEDRAQRRLRLLGTGSIDAVTQEFFLRSHLEGRVVARAVNPGVEVQGQFSGGAPSGELFTIGSTDWVWLFADVGESELSELQVGAQVEAHVLAYPERAFHGRVEWVSPTLDPALRTARIRASLPNPEGLLKPEMFATVSIARAPLMKLAVPREAVVRINDQSFAYVAEGARADGRQVFRRRHVQVPEYAGRAQQRPRGSEVFPLAGAREPELVPVLAGLAEGEEVLVDSGLPRQRPAGDVFLTREQLGRGKVAVANVTESDVPDFVTVGGRLTFDDLKVTHVFSPVNGRITRVLASPGEHVKKGAPLAVILSPDLGSALSDELKARADLTAAEHEVKRQREMYELRASAQRDLEAAEDNYGKARAEYERAAQKARLLRRAGAGSNADNGGAVSQELVLRSPIEGEVIARNANPGAEVQGQYAAGPSVLELFTVGSLDSLWLLGDVYETDLPYVKPGAEVQVRVSAYPGRTFRGKVDWISDALDPVLRTAKVRCVLENQLGLLRPEMYEVVEIAAPARRALTVPRDSILRLGDETDVFVEGDATQDGRVPFRRRRVVANEQLPGDAVPVLSGLKQGERVAARGAIFLVGN